RPSRGSGHKEVYRLPTTRHHLERVPDGNADGGTRGPRPCCRSRRDGREGQTARRGRRRRERARGGVTSRSLLATVGRPDSHPGKAIERRVEGGASGTDVGTNRDLRPVGTPQRIDRHGARQPAVEAVEPGYRRADERRLDLGIAVILRTVKGI